MMAGVQGIEEDPASFTDLAADGPVGPVSERSPEQVAKVELLPQPYRTMMVVEQCIGLRAEYVLALKWQDIDFENLSMKLVRAVVHGRGRGKTVKTQVSTTMNVYGNALMGAKREANSKIAKMALRSA
jgi:hypothetical protein